jgi:hypothetical protein
MHVACLVWYNLCHEANICLDFTYKALKPMGLEFCLKMAAHIDFCTKYIL